METQEFKNKNNFKCDYIKSNIDFADFMKADVRICEILSVEKVEDKDKLYKLEINTGVDMRIVVSAIAHQITPEQLLNKRFPFILNLPPKPIANIVSAGMIVMAMGRDDKFYEVGDQSAEVGAIIV